jgi:acid phosphatase family membrane protein YuiD
MLRDHPSRRASHRTHPKERPTAPRHGLLSVRSAVIFAIATAGGLLAGWSQPGLGLGAWLALVVGLDAIIDHDQPHSG